MGDNTNDGTVVVTQIYEEPFLFMLGSALAVVKFLACVGVSTNAYQQVGRKECP